MDRTAPLVGTSDCQAASDILGRVGDKWTVLVIVALRDGSQRFGELTRQVGGVSQQMLSSTLKALERDGMVVRTVRATNPPQVSYELTDLGHSLSRTVGQLASWSIANLTVIQNNRKQYDEHRT